MAEIDVVDRQSVATIGRDLAGVDRTRDNGAAVDAVKQKYLGQSLSPYDCFAALLKSMHGDGVVGCSNRQTLQGSGGT